MGNPLNITEKAKILRFLGYPNWTSLAQSFQLGFPSEGQPEFLVRLAFDRIAPESLDLIRKDLCELEDIEAQLTESRRRMRATQLGNLHINRSEAAELRREMRYWTQRLADDLGTYTNPWSNFSINPGGNGNMNAKVLGS